MITFILRRQSWRLYLVELMDDDGRFITINGLQAPQSVPLVLARDSLIDGVGGADVLGAVGGDADFITGVNRE